jgi:hypothetical protein
MTDRMMDPGCLGWPIGKNRCGPSESPSQYIPRGSHDDDAVEALVFPVVHTFRFNLRIASDVRLENSGDGVTAFKYVVPRQIPNETKNDGSASKALRRPR